MITLTAEEVDSVSGGTPTMDQALDLIGGIAAVCACIPGLQGAAAFGGGIYAGGKLVEYIASF